MNIIVIRYIVSDGSVDGIGRPMLCQLNSGIQFQVLVDASLATQHLMHNLPQVNLLLLLQGIILHVPLLQIQHHQYVLVTLLQVHHQHTLQNVIQTVSIALHGFLLGLALLEDLAQRHSCYLQLRVVVQQMLENTAFGF